MSKRKKLTIILIIFLLLALFYGLGKQIYSSLQSSKRLEIEIEAVDKLQKKNTQLKKKFQEVQTPQFIEREARDKLNFSRPNETVIIIPEEEIEKVLNAQKGVEEIKLPNWQGWLRLFFK